MILALAVLSSVLAFGFGLAWINYEEPMYAWLTFVFAFGTIFLFSMATTALESKVTQQYNVTCKNAGETVYVDVISDLNELHGYEDCRIQLLETK